MPSRLIELPLSSEPLFEVAATFLCVLAYPEDDSRADRFRTAMIREYFRSEALTDKEFASRPLPLRPLYFAMTDEFTDREWTRGRRRVLDRQKAALATFPLLERALSGRRVDTIRGFGTTAKNNVRGRAEMVMYWEHEHNVSDNERQVADQDPLFFSKNLTTRVLNPSKPVIHAAFAFWRRVIEIKERLRIEGVKDQGVAQGAALNCILRNDEIFARVVELAEDCRRIAPSIPQLRVRDEDLIGFRIV